MSHSAAGEPPPGGRHAGPAGTAIFSDVDWRLLVRLPSQVVVAAASAGPDDPRLMVGESLAGLEGIAAGRAFDSDLVRAVVAAIYAESADLPSLDRRDPASRAAATLSACRRAVAILTEVADPADSAAYRQWVQSVAFRVCRAGEDVAPAAPFDPVRRAGFLGELRRALALG
ncbi:hypothetical protein [Plantactinospora sp. KBS50]|uniref:hypothetical protein n=1 Tax=Plantactinospora sp. KBS50 TaxID=2024580 RepID=UPI000BAABE8C|nr:hypothetical protein [Plantactinospora sp. KBS50]ASW57387.1 hypothetical protein CIK06_03120 [Plantactinospora sp. KBS50]